MIKCPFGFLMVHQYIIYNKQNFHSLYSLRSHIKVNSFLYCHPLKILYRDLNPRRYRSQNIFSFYLVLCCKHYVLSWNDLNPRKYRSQNIFYSCCNRVMNSLLGCNHVMNTLLSYSWVMNVLLDLVMLWMLHSTGVSCNFFYWFRIYYYPTFRSFYIIIKIFYVYTNGTEN